MNVTKWFNSTPGPGDRPGHLVQAPGHSDITDAAIKRLWSETHERLTNDQEVVLVRYAQLGSDAARLALLAAYMPLLKSLVSGLAGSDTEDLRQTAVAGLFRALDETPKGERVRPRIVFSVRHELDEMHYEHTLISIPSRTRRRFAQILRKAEGDPIEAAEIAPDMGMTPDVFWACYMSADFETRADTHTLAEELHPHFEADYDNVDDRMTVAALKAGAALDDREIAVVDAFAAGQTDAATAAVLGIDRTRVVHIRSAAFARMTQASRATKEIEL